MSGFKLNIQDLKFVLAQIKIAEAHAAGTPITQIWVDAHGNVVPANTAGATLAVPTPMSPYGLRTVDGSYNNIVPGREFWGAADTVMPRALDASFRDDADGDSMFLFPGPGGTLTNTNYNGTGSVADADPRIISNLIADMTLTNPAAVQAWLDNPLSQAKWHEEHGDNAVPLFPGDNPNTPNGVFVTNADISYIPNISPDDGISVSFNAWMTFFGQFFDHGLDLISKGGNVGKVYIPLQDDDPLVLGDDGVLGTADDLPPQFRFMVLTRSTVAPGGGHEATNTTTSWVDQNQTYTSHASHQVFLREYVMEGGKPHATGHLLDGSNGGLPTWADVKSQALMLGIELTDGDALNIPLIRTDQYGKFIPDPTTGMAQLVIGLGVDGIPNTADDIVVSGTPGAPVNTFSATNGALTGAVRIGHAFLDDIADEAIPVFGPGGVLIADADDVIGGAPQPRNAQGQKLSYDDELLDRHFITGDGRGNENIGLTTVHHIFHSEHNRQVEQQKLTVLSSMDLAFINEWLDTDLTSLAGHPGPNATLLQLQAFANTLNWDGERLFQAGRFATEMQYQHLVFEEFARKIQPNIDFFVFNSQPDINPTIFAEFAHTVYRFGHSMLTDNMPRIDGSGNIFDADLDLVEAFTNPLSFDHIDDGNPNNDMTADEAAASIVRGMTIETGNAIDEFLVDSLRNNLLGLPLDLAALNIARGREAGVPSLNDVRTQLYAASGSSFLKPYDNWVDFAANLKNTASVVNFLAAYGKHPSIPEDGTLEQKRDAAMLLIFGGVGAPADRVQFLTGTGAWANQATGLNDIDFWIGGLAEKILPFGGMLGSTFNAIFELQLENLQDGDRFYYLTRTQGQNLIVSLEQNSFIKMIMANTDLAQPGPDGIRGTEDDIVLRHVGVDSFGKYDYVLEVNAEHQADYSDATTGELAAANAALAAAQADADDAVAASDAADAAVVDAAAALAATIAADTTDAVVLQAEADAATAAALALTSTAELNALLAAIAANAGVVDAAIAFANAVQADQAADAAAAAAQAAANAAHASDAQVAAANSTLLLATTAAVDASAQEAAAQAALDAAQEELDALVAQGVGRDPLSDNPILAALGISKVTRDNPNTVGPDVNFLRFIGGEHVVVGGTDGNDHIITDDGDDGIWGDAGDDRIESGAGVDLVNGGAGNDIITDSGDSGDFLKGDEGDDVIANSNGLDIVMGGTGQDAVFVGVDDTEVFAGQGNDFVLGGAGLDGLLGNEGDDWLEGMGGFDTLSGDMSELNFDSKIIGHDVLLPGSEESDVDAESGDDITVMGESVIRTEGMFGFDWVTYKGIPLSADGDLGIPIFTTEQADILRDRFDKVEALSGWTYDDMLVGDDRIFDPNFVLQGNINANGEGVFFRDELNQAGIDRIAGLDQIVTNDLMRTGVYGADWSDSVQRIFDGGNILLGGGGNDVLIGKGGNDIIDGDKWLNVRIRITAAGADNTAANQLATIDSMQHTFTVQEAQAAGQPSWAGKSLFQLMLDRTIVPNQLHIVREVLNGNEQGDVDTAVFWDQIQNYTLTRANDGTITVSHTGFAQGSVVPTTGVALQTRFLPVSDGVDTLRNIEVLRFGDGAGGFINYTIGQLFPFAPTGAAIISDTTPTEGQTLSVDTSTIADLNGLGPFTYQWQRSTNGNTWININGATGASFAVPDAAGTGLGALADQFLRVRVIYTDGFGDNEVVTSASTTRVGANYDASNANNAVNFTGTRGDNIVVGSNFNDTLAGREGDDVITGGRGNDTIGGGVGNDTAVFTGPLTNYAFATAGTGIQVTDRIGNEGADSLQLIEVLRFAGVNYTVVNGTTGADANLNGAAGAAGSQAIFGRQGVDSLNGGDGADILVGGGGNDAVRGGNGDDYVFMTSNEGRDFIDGGADTDTFVLNGVAGAEVFNVMTRTYALSIGITGLNANTEIVITRNGTNNGSIIAELDNIEEITINSLLTSANDGNGVVNGGPNDGDTINVFGDFTTTSLNYSTIHIAGSAGNDTVNISGLSSDHRVVFDSNGGADTFIGDVRPQDVVTGIPGLTAAALGAGGGVESEIELMDLMQDFELSAAHGVLESVTMRTGLDMLTLGAFGPVAGQLAGAHDMLDDLSMTMPSTRLIVNDYALV